MTRTPNRGGIVASQFAIISLAFCFLAAFTFRCTLDIDGHGNVGDETMTAALTSNLALGSLPPYGYRPDGTPWTWGVNTAPVYSWFYSPAVRLTSPLRRIEAARLVSRALGALTLFLLAVGLLQLVARSPLGAIPLPAQVGLLVFTVLALVNSPRFRFIASFARVDVLGLAFLTAVIAAASRVVLRPRALSVFLFVLLSLSVAWTSYIAFFLVGFIAAATLLICATQFIQVPLMAGARRLMLEIILPSVGAALLFVALSASLHGALFSGPASGVASTIAANFSWTPTTRPQLQALERPERGWFLNAALIGFLVVAAKAAIQASPQESRDHRPMESVPRLVRDLVPLGIAVGMSTVIYRVWLITLPIRFTYDVMIVTAFAALQLIVFGFILRSRPIDRYIMSGAVLVALLWSSLYPWGLPGMAWFLCREDADLVKGRLWPVSSVLVGLYNPFDETRDVGNLARYSAR